MKEIKIKNIDVGTHDEKTVKMNTIIVGDWTQPKIVFIHGFGMSNTLFYKIFAPLKKHYCLILIDMIGCGASSRPENFDRT
jgi:pimeloyl-ACP methyl ester carboxylesterase